MTPVQFLKGLVDAGLLVLRITSSLCVRLALVLEHHLLYHVAIGVLVHTVAPHVGLTYVRMILLGRCRCRVYRRLRGSPYSRQAGKVDQVEHVAFLSTYSSIPGHWK